MVLKNAWAQGDRPFVVVKESVFLGMFLSKVVCAEILGSDLRAIQDWDLGERLAIGDLLLIPIGLGLTIEEILSSAISTK